MRSRIWVLAVTLTAAVLALLGTPAPNALADIPVQLPSVHVYDGHHRPALLVTTTGRRGLPTAHDTHNTYNAVGAPSRGASHCHDHTRPEPTTTYTTPVEFAQGAQAMGTPRAPALVVNRGFVVADRGGVATNAGDDVVRALSATERRTLDDALRPDKLDHIFDPKHNFQPLVQQFGSREAALEQIVRSIGGPLPKAGRFEIAQSIGGQPVIIRGAVVDGIPRIGTAFTP
jgi:hypothetical protein